MSATIFALATGASRAAVAVVRISGPETQAVLHKMAGGAPIPRRAALRQLQRPDTGEVLDQGLVFWFPGPASYTGEDSAEFHVHGGRAVVETVLDTLVRQGLRCAEPGEFTRRAFQNGKLDLTQAEAVADLVDAETDAQRRQALGQLRGDLARRHADWRLILVEALAVLEAAVDFPDEEVPETVADEAAPALADLAMELDAALQDAVRGERVRDGYRIAVIGAPNAGKSSLLNALVGRDAAIVTPAAGTTRDIIEIEQDWGGFRVILADTAGLRDASDPAEIEGVRRARAWASDAALRLWVVDAAAGEDTWREAISLARSGDLCVLNKSDLPSGPASEEASTWARTQGLGLASVSAASGSGVVGLKEALTARVAAALTGVDFPAVTRERHVRDLTLARSHVARALAALSVPVQVELAAEDVRLAARSLARVSGRIDPEDVLDRVFARFCIGK